MTTIRPYNGQFENTIFFLDHPAFPSTITIKGISSLIPVGTILYLHSDFTGPNCVDVKFVVELSYFSCTALPEKEIEVPFVDPSRGETYKVKVIDKPCMFQQEVILKVCDAK